MADKIVHVSFTPPDHWVFSQPVTSMRAPGKLFVKPAEGRVAWAFAAAEVIDGGVQFHVNVKDDRVTIHDRHTALGAYTYTVTVRQDGRWYTSPAQAGAGGAYPAAGVAAERPPQILNEPAFGPAPGPDGEA